MNILLILLMFSPSLAAAADFYEYASSHKIGAEFAPSLNVGMVEYQYDSNATPIGCERSGGGTQKCSQLLVPDSLSAYNFFLTRSGDRTGWFLVDWGISMGLNKFRNKPFNFSDYSTDELTALKLANTDGPSQPIQDFSLNLTRLTTRAFVRLGFTPPLFPELIWTGGYGLQGMWGNLSYNNTSHFQRLYATALFNEVEFVWVRLFGGVLSSFFSLEVNKPTPLMTPKDSEVHDFRMTAVNVSIGLVRIVSPLPF